MQHCPSCVTPKKLGHVFGTAHGPCEGQPGSRVVKTGGGLNPLIEILVGQNVRFTPHERFCDPKKAIIRCRGNIYVEPGGTRLRGTRLSETGFSGPGLVESGFVEQWNQVK